MTSKIIADMVDTIETRDRELAALREANEQMAECCEWQAAKLDAAERMAKAIMALEGHVDWHGNFNVELQELRASAAAFRELVKVID